MLEKITDITRKSIILTHFKESERDNALTSSKSNKSNQMGSEQAK